MISCAPSTRSFPDASISCSWSTPHDSERGHALSLVGNLADLGLGDIFQIVSLSRRSGTLQLTTPLESGEIVFRAGKVVAAFRTSGDRSVGEGLLESGVIAPTVYQEMLAAQKAGKRAPELFAAFGIERDALHEALEGILKQVVYAMFEWAEGTFSFVLEDSPDIWRGFALEGGRAVAENGLNPQYLAIEGARLRDERAKEDSLSSFLMKGQSPGAQRAAGGLNVQEIAAKLRTAAELDAKPAAAPSGEKVIPFPAERVRGRTGEASPNDEIDFASVSAAAAALADTSPAPAAPGQLGAVTERGSAAKAREVVLAAADEAPGPAPVAAPAAASSEPAAAPGALALRYRLLAVDDDPQVTRHIQTAFGRRFALTTAVDTVKDALADLEADPRDVIVASDLIIARSDGRGILGGIEILERVRARWPDMPVVLFTDYQNEEAEARARSMGALAVLLKPRRAQVQAAGKDGPVVRSFLDALGKALTPYFDVPGREGAASGSGSEAAPREAAVAAPEGPARDGPVDVAASHASRTAAPETPGAESRGPAVAPAAAAAPGALAGFDLGSEISVEMDELGQRLESELPPPLLSAGDMAVLRSMLAELIDPANRDTVTLLVLRFASHIVERAGLFLATRRVFVGLGGFSIDEPSDRFVARVRRIQVPVDQESIFSRVARFRSMIRGPLKETDGNRALVQGLGGPWPAGDTVAAPLISGDRVAAILYGHNPSGKPLGPTDGLEIFLQQAGLAMDRALLERKLEDSRRRGAP